MIDHENILKVLEKESRWLTFDELYSKAQPDCDWTVFAAVLEGFVEQGQVQYMLPHGVNSGYCCIGFKGNN